MSEPFHHRSYRGPLQAVILDWAGTTVDFGSQAPVRAVIEAFRELDVPITREQARAPMGKAKREHLRAILEDPEVAERWENAHGSTIDEAVDALYDRFLPLQQQLLAEHAALIPGCLETTAFCRGRGMKIGSSTGYYRELMDVLVPLASRQGYDPDVVVSASDVAPGRPAPWMCLENARRLQVFPMASIVKVDDTTVGVEAGLHAGMWSVGVAATGNLLGLGEQELAALDQQERDAAVTAARGRLLQAGAHLTIDSIADLPSALQQIDQALHDGVRP